MFKPSRTQWIVGLVMLFLFICLPLFYQGYDFVKLATLLSLQTYLVAMLGAALLVFSPIPKWRMFVFVPLLLLLLPLVVIGGELIFLLILYWLNLAIALLSAFITFLVVKTKTFIVHPVPAIIVIAIAVVSIFNWIVRLIFT